MSAPRQTEARRRAYLVLWGLLEGRLDRGSLAWVRRIPQLAECLPPLDDEDLLDELAAAHHHLFERDLAPYAGVYQHPDGLAGGDAAQAVLASLGDTSFFVEPLGDRTSDHLFILLAIVGHEAEALHLAGLDRAARADPGLLEARRVHLRDSLDRHLLSWLPDFVAGARRVARGEVGTFWARVLELTLGTLADQRRDLGGVAWVPPDELGPPLATTGPVPDVVARLAVPLQAGTFLCRSDLEALARGLGLPAGFGRRAEQLRGLGEAALHLGDPVALLDALDDLLARSGRDRAALAAEHALEAYVAPWDARLEETRAALRGLAGCYRAAPRG